MSETALSPSVRLPKPAASRPAPERPDFDGRRSLVGGLVRTARPHQWVKNLLVLAAPGAAGVLTQGPALARASIAFAVFCVAASGTYFMNDVVDREHDRRHPTKHRRPVASGVVPRRVASAVADVMLPGALVVGWLTLGGFFAACVGAYLAVNLAYNLRLRYEPVFDLAAVASGFVIRAIAGGLATGVQLSEWFLVVTSFASLFVVAGKRTAARFDVGDAHRPPEPRVHYPVSYLRYVRALGSGVAIAAYCLWAFEKSAAVRDGVWFQWTIAPFVLAMLRYALLVEQYEGESPEDLLLRDATILVLVVVWAAMFALAVYGS